MINNKNKITFQDAGDDESYDDFEIIEIDSNRFATNLHVPKHYIGAIIGKKGVMRSRIERDTGTNIKIPRQGEAGDITIFGPSVTNVKAACRRINIIVMSSRMKQKPTHFISIPLNTPTIMKNFEKFKETVLQEVKDLDESLFIGAHKLHITVGVMCLMDNEERLQATKLLSEAKDQIIMPLLQEKLPLQIRLKGLSYMNDDPKNIHVLYANVEDEAGTDIIQRLADDLVNFFHKAGFMRNNEYGRDRVKLHVTLLNSKYRSKSNSEETSTNGRKVKEPFDGSQILNKFVDYDFGVTEITDVHLSQMKTMGDDGYYQPTFVVTLNKN
ncbi:PREDICTED: activating signal cointegrator 1 complex subunit 1 isoform X2 [Papilio xuthus]|uniref:Activating signal cointegrator 1 complex subunit 1 isoform X2 n=1 Tax=Papilio xuthus TaxID=66420 RepID=A0AAJ6ZAE8_PAPXU|nr:PREDICTED: activating signal cointegrator 1 complex subunit 1 isoform X2 [Papilio xuthus]